MEDRNKPDGVQIWLELIAHYTHIVRVNKIDVIRADIERTPPCGVIFGQAVGVTRSGFQSFQKELRDKLSQSHDRKTDLRLYMAEFMPYIAKFKQWYSEHQYDLRIFEKNNPYQYFYDAIIDTEKELLRHEEAITVKKQKANQLRDTLEKACIGPDQCQALRSWFIDNGLCNPDTFIWIDTKKGGKSILVNYLKDAHANGYIQELTHEEIRVIAKNDFGTEISIDLIKRSGSNGGKICLPSYK